jgi:CHASE3 domain sensor protein/putative methionine-R-sulfoxide reductase with GAF domain
MMNKLKKNFIAVSLSVLVILIVFGTVLSIYNRSVMIKNYALQKQTEEVKQRWTNIFESILRRIDLGLRGYALTKNNQLLDPYESAMRDNEPNLNKIDSLLVVQNLDSIRSQFANIRMLVKDYVRYSQQMKAMVDVDSVNGFVSMLNRDKGYDLWQVYAPIYNKVLSHENKLVEQAQINYENAQNRNVMVQFILLLFGLPTIIGVILKLHRDNNARRELLLEFERNNRKYMFDPGTDLPDDNPQIIIETSIQNLKRASAFIKDISSENYTALWEGLDDKTLSLNQNNLSGELIKMRDQMKRVKEEDERRLWTTEGLAKFADVARNNQNDVQKLSNEVVSFLTKYLRAQQGSLFILMDSENESDSYLGLTACYAFDKKKHIDKRIDIGSGLVGQTYKEGVTCILTEVPAGYVSITSGLGDATPGSIIIVPMKYNDRVEAIFELASFEKFEPFEIDFLEKAGEVIASAIYSTKTNEKTSALLRESRELAETLRAQEEELRQNMEEMQATQESMRRKEKEID